MGIIPHKVEESQTPLSIRLMTVDQAARAFYKAPSKVIETEMLRTIEGMLPDSYVVYTTAQGIVVERLADCFDDKDIPLIHLHVEQQATPDHCCPNCKLNLLNEEHGEIVDSFQECGKQCLTVVCRHCWQFWVVRK